MTWLYPEVLLGGDRPLRRPGWHHWVALELVSDRGGHPDQGSGTAMIYLPLTRKSGPLLGLGRPQLDVVGVLGSVCR